MKQTETGDRIFLSCSPFSAAKWHGKNPDCQGFKGGDFFAAYKRKNTTRPLTVWIVGTAVLRFAFFVESSAILCYTDCGILHISVFRIVQFFSTAWSCRSDGRFNLYFVEHICYIKKRTFQIIEKSAFHLIPMVIGFIFFPASMSSYWFSRISDTLCYTARRGYAL